MPVLFFLSLAFAGAPLFDPMRGHQWSEDRETAMAIEQQLPDSSEQPPRMRNVVIESSFLRYEFLNSSPFEFVAFGFNDTGLARIIYPLHLPMDTSNIDKPSTDVPERFSAVRAWLLGYLGPPDDFASSLPDDPFFDNVEMLLENAEYSLRYTWCSPLGFANLVARREPARDPVLVATFESPQHHNESHYCTRASGIKVN